MNENQEEDISDADNVILDKVVDKIFLFGIPGLVLMFAMAKTGLVGAAALTAALASLGPGGMIGGIASLGVIGVVSASGYKYLIKKGYKEHIFKRVLKKIKEKDNLTTDELREKIRKIKLMPKGLKNDLLSLIDKL